MADRRSVPVLRAPRRRVPARPTSSSAPTRRSTVATSARTSRAATAGACTTATPCPGFRSTRTAGSRRSRSCAEASSITPTRSARPRASATATCSGSPRATASCTARCSRCSTANSPNPVELFQIWLQPARGRQARRPVLHDALGRRHPAPRGHRRRRSPHRGHRRRRRARGCSHRLRRRRTRGRRAPTPTSRSGMLRLDAGATWTLPPRTRARTVRTLYFFEGGELRVAGRDVERGHRARAPAGRRRRRTHRRSTSASSASCCRAARSASRSRSTGRS